MGSPGGAHSESRYTAALAEGRMAFGVFCALDGLAVSHLFASVGYDFVVLDLQHAAFTWPDVENMCFRIRSTGAAVFLRTASTEPAEVNLALDLPDRRGDPAQRRRRSPTRPLRWHRRSSRPLGSGRWATSATTRSGRRTRRPIRSSGMLVEHSGRGRRHRARSSPACRSTSCGSGSMTSRRRTAATRTRWWWEMRCPTMLEDAITRTREAARANGVRYWAGEPGADATIAGVDARIVRQAATDALTRVRERFAGS